MRWFKTKWHDLLSSLKKLKWLGFSLPMHLLRICWSSILLPKNEVLGSLEDGISTFSLWANIHGDIISTDSKQHGRNQRHVEHWQRLLHRSRRNKTAWHELGRHDGTPGGINAFPPSIVWGGLQLLCCSKTPSAGLHKFGSMKESTYWGKKWSSLGRTYDTCQYSRTVMTAHIFHSGNLGDFPLSMLGLPIQHMVQLQIMVPWISP